MKKGGAVLFLLLLAVCGATGVFAQSENDFEAETKDGKVTITKYTGKADDVIIPATIGGKNSLTRGRVVAIGKDAFAYRKDLSSINIPASVTSIDGWAFLNCTGLTSISIGVGVTSIGADAFEGCTGLTWIRIGANVELEYRSFSDGFLDYYGLTTYKKAGVYTFRNGAWFTRRSRGVDLDYRVRTGVRCSAWF